MFNFIFDGKIGEMLAPVTGSNQFYLSIQHHRNEECRQLLNAQTRGTLSQLSDGGVAAIHIACRYNNTFAVDEILKQGVNVELKDSSGNTPLHFAAKYGHLELCKSLISRGASPVSKNSSNQSPYDITENHVIRQYLLPLQFASERQQGGNNDNMYGLSSAASYDIYGQGTSAVSNMPPQNVGMSMSTQQYPPQQGHTILPPQHSIPMSVPNQNITSQPVSTMTMSGPSTAVIPPPPALTSSTTTAVSGGMISGSPPRVTTTSTSGGGSNSNTNTPNNSVRRMIPIDGFHSSASDPELQKKYGHVKASINIAPPPTQSTGASHSSGIAAAGGGQSGTTAPSYSMYSNSPYSQQSAMPSGSLASRYVGYDAHTNQAAPVMPGLGVAAAPVAGYSNIPIPNIMHMTNISGSSHSTPPIQSQHQSYQYQPSVSQPLPPNITTFIPPPPPAVNSTPYSATVIMPPTAGNYNNTAVSNTNIPAPPANMNTNVVNNQFQPLVKVFNPANETGEVVSLDSTSRAIL